MQRPFLIFAAAALLSATPAAAQHYDKGSEFVEAVRKSDGNKVRELLQDKPMGLINSRNYDGDTALLIAVARRDE